ncbi:Alpha/Beta hydrolase protein [Sporodiniella umbellata]|nr:Alpha/Beta hydrolase protein [Sporodiniella umbellata]
MSLTPNHRRIDEVSSATLNTNLNANTTTKTNVWRAQTPSNLTEWIIYLIGFFQPTRKHRPSGYWRYVLGVYKNLFLSFYFNWFVIFTAPLSSFAFILAYPIISGLLFAFELGLKLFMDGLGGDHLAKLISRDYGGGFSMINWGAPELLLSEQTSDLIKATVPSLCSPPAFISDHRHRVFDVSIAQTMTVLSTLVYERDDDKMQQAFRMQDMKSKDVEKKMEQLIWESESPIRHITSLYGLQFAGVTECKSLCGPFCGLYWSEEHPVIIIAFKGTTPTNYSEFMVDATLQRTDARTYLFGSAHEGFYDSLFPTHMDNEDSKDPYYAIQVALIERAKLLQAKFGPDPVHVWVTGHSLGAAIGSLLFARWLKCPEDIEPYCTLRDCYVIGTPAVGDSEFASYFASYSNMPLSRTSTLWRVINQSDIICRVPPGYNSSTVGHYAPTTDFFNYSHVGHAIQITHPILSSKPIKAYPSSYESNLEVVLSSGNWKSNWSHGMAQKEYKHANKQENKYARTEDASYSAWTKATLNRFGMDPISFIESFYPFFIRDHIPIHYFNGLERARQYCLEREKEHQ